jgi:hypothetical protein
LKKLLSMIVGATLFLFSGSAFAQNLVTNGGFELGSPGGVGFGGFPGWTPVNEGVAHFNSGSSFTFLDDGSYSLVVAGPHSGNYMADFGSMGMATGIQQAVATTPGGTYEVSFWLANDDGADPLKGSFTSILVTFGTSTLINTTNQPRFGYTFYDFLVTASGPSSMLGFDIRQDPNYYYLDDVSVKQVPEPGSLALLCSGLGLGAGFIKKRFRS